MAGVTNGTGEDGGLRAGVEALQARVEDLVGRVTRLEVRGAGGQAPARGQPGGPREDEPRESARRRATDIREQVRSLLEGNEDTAGVALGVALRQPAVPASPAAAQTAADRGAPVVSTSTMAWGAAGPGGDLRETARVLAALGSDTRLRLMQLLWQGEKGAPELAEASGLTTGSLYHHVRELIAFRWIDSPRRNRYVLTPAGRKALAVACAIGRFAPPGM
jgi:hypothetical protein